MESEPMMRAALYERYGSPTNVEIRSIPKPAPAEGEVLVKVRFSSVNTADLDLVRGIPPVMRAVGGLRRPRNGRLGADMVGEVVQVGEAVDAFKPGDAVWADLFESGHPAFSEYVCVPSKSLRLKPRGLDDAVAATIPHSGLLALQALRRGDIQPGESVLINGAGGCVGPFAIQIAKARGATVVGVDRPDKFDLMTQAGADRVVDYTVSDITRDSERFDVILDIAATRSPRRFQPILADGGRYVHLARSLAGFFRAAAIGAATNRWKNSRTSNFAWKANNPDDLAEMAELVGSGAVAPFIGGRYELADLPEALRRHGAGEVDGKILISVDGD